MVERFWGRQRAAVGEEGMPDVRHLYHRAWVHGIMDNVYLDIDGSVRKGRWKEMSSGIAEALLVAWMMRKGRQQCPGRVIR